MRMHKYASDYKCTIFSLFKYVKVVMFTADPEARIYGQLKPCHIPQPQMAML